MKCVLLEMANAGFINHTSGQVLRSKEWPTVPNMFSYIDGKSYGKNISLSEEQLQLQGIARSSDSMEGIISVQALLVYFHKIKPTI